MADRIDIHPDICNGRPIIAGTRIPVQTIMEFLGASPSDTQIWQYAKQNDLAIVTKDADFSDRLMVDSSPPKVVHLRFGNLRKRFFHAFLTNVWLKIETLLVDHKLINVYFDRIEAIK